MEKRRKLHKKCNAVIVREDENGNEYCQRVNSAWRSKRWHKKLSNKKIRKTKNLKNGRYCHKVYDYWWEIS